MLPELAEDAMWPIFTSVESRDTTLSTESRKYVALVGFLPTVAKRSVDERRDVVISKYTSYRLDYPITKWVDEPF